jgi:hypothetical protein
MLYHFGTTAFDQPEVTMSADKHRGIRRQKQKRAKDRKKKVQQLPPRAGGQGASTDTSAQVKAE